MLITANTSLVEALQAIFGKTPVEHKQKVTVTLDKDITPNQFTLLAQTSFVLGQGAPRILRSGAGVSVIFG
jgi:hypothetical protein